jgi:uncharacterized protein (DUF2384 family)
MPTEMSVAYVDEVEKAKRLAPLTDADIARATGTTAGTVAAWRARRQTPRGRRAHRVAELAAIVEQLATVVKPDYIPVWLNKPLPALGHRTPADVLADGGYERVAGLVDELIAPTFT